MESPITPSHLTFGYLEKKVTKGTHKRTAKLTQISKADLLNELS